MKVILITTKILSPAEAAAAEAEWKKAITSKISAAELESTSDLAAVIERFEAASTEEQRTVSLIICHYQSKSTALLTALLETLPTIPSILLFDVGSQHQKKVVSQSVIAAIETAQPIKDLPSLLESLIQSNAIKLALQEDADYISISPDSLISQGHLISDVYIKLSKGRYLKLLKSKDTFTKEDLKKFKEKKKLDLLYIHKSDAKIIFNKDLNALKSIDEFELTPEQAEKVTKKALDNLHSIVSGSGFSPEAAEIATASVTAALKAMGRTPRLQGALEALKKGKGKYITNHSIALGQVACGVAHTVGWHSATTYFKLTLASFLHDLSLQNDDLAAVRRLSQLEENPKWTKEQKADYKLHPLRASEFVRQINAIPPDVDTIIAQHHERPDGSGFPRGLDSVHITPLAAAFIIAHDLVDYFYDNGVTAEISKFLEKNSDNYKKGGTFKKVFQAFVDQAKIPMEEP